MCWRGKSTGSGRCEMIWLREFDMSAAGKRRFFVVFNKIFQS